MSKQLTISAALSIALMAGFALLGQFGSAISAAPLIGG